MNSPPDRPIEIDVHEVAQLLDDDEPLLLLDCREDVELAIARIEGAKHIPMQQIPARLHELPSDRESRLVVLCHHGLRSRQVVHWLRQQGFDQAQNMSGGIDQWSIKIDDSIARY